MTIDRRTAFKTMLGAGMPMVIGQTSLADSLLRPEPRSPEAGPGTGAAPDQPGTIRTRAEIDYTILVEWDGCPLRDRPFSELTVKMQDLTRRANESEFFGFAPGTLLLEKTSCRAERAPKPPVLDEETGLLWIACGPIVAVTLYHIFRYRESGFRFAEEGKLYPWILRQDFSLLNPFDRHPDRMRVWANVEVFGRAKFGPETFS